MTREVKVRFITLLVLLFCGITIYGAENKQALAIGEFEKNQCILKDRYIRIIFAGQSSTYELVPDPKKYETSLAEETLSEADKLNGIEYKGTYRVQYEGPRRRKALRSAEWGAWGDGEVIIKISIIDTNGDWSSSLVSRGYGEDYIRSTWTSINEIYSAMFQDEEQQLGEAIDFLAFGLSAIQEKLPKGIAKGYFENAARLVQSAYKQSEYRGSLSRDVRANIGSAFRYVERIAEKTDEMMSSFESNPTVLAEIMKAQNIISDIRGSIKR